MVIYGLSSTLHPLDIRYVGKTKNINDRLRRHISKYSLNNESSYKNNWIKSELLNGNGILITIIEEVNDDNWQEREIFWISKYRELGYKLTNGTFGGEGILLTKDVISKRNKTKVDNNIKDKLSEISKYDIKQIDGKWVGVRVCNHCLSSVSHKGTNLTNLLLLIKKSHDRKCLNCRQYGGFRLTQEAKDKISKSKENISQNTRDKLSKLHKNKVLTEETKEKIRVSLIGKKSSQETKDKISLLHSVSLLCIETDEVYKSIGEASHKLNINYAYLCSVIRNGTNRVKNYTFIIIEK